MTRPLALNERWRALAPREQSLVLTASAVVAAALLWWLAIAPALATLRAAPARHATLDTQLQHMQRLQAEAQQLQSAPKTGPGDAVGALRMALTQQLGKTAQLNVVGDRATVTLKAAPADGLAQWLTQARSNARTTPLEARLTLSGAAATAPSAPTPVVLGGQSIAAPARWDGTVVLALPAPTR